MVVMGKLREAAKELTRHLDALFNYLYLNEPKRFKAKNWQKLKSLSDDVRAEIAREESAEVLSVPDEDHIGKFRRDARETSRKAALAVKPRTGTQRRRVLDIIAKYGTLTDEEIQNKLSINSNAERPRRLELVEGGWLEDSGHKQWTSSGHEAILWRLTEKAHKELGIP